MKAERITRTFILLVSGVVCLFLSLSSASQASEYLGTYCWRSSVDGTIYEFALNDMGDFHYLINGTATFTDDTLIPINGNAEVGQSGGDVLIGVTFNGGALGSTSTVAVSINWTLDGTLNGFGAGTLTSTDYQQGQTTISLITDSLNAIICP